MADKPVQIVYVLTNPAMPGLVKIGKTTQLEVEERMKQLYSTGVPVPFDCAFACKVKDATDVEKALHLAFGMTRINPNREFFKLGPERVIAVLQLLKVDDITQQFEQTIESDIPSADKQSAQALKRSMLEKRKSISWGQYLHSRQQPARCLDFQKIIRFSHRRTGRSMGKPLRKFMKVFTVSKQKASLVFERICARPRGPIT